MAVVAHWVKFQIFGSLERWKRNFWNKININFYCEEGAMWSSINYFKLIAINCMIYHSQSLLLNINKWNLKVIISDWLFFVFLFHICFCPIMDLGTCFILLRILRYPVNLSSELTKIKYESFLVQKLWSAWYKISSWPTRLSYLIHWLLTLHSTT